MPKRSRTQRRFAASSLESIPIGGYLLLWYDETVGSVSRFVAKIYFCGGTSDCFTT